MIRPLAGAIAGFGFLFSSLPAQAQSVDQDVRCLIVSNFFSRTETEPKKKLLATAASFYFTGRVGARVSGDPLKAIFVAQAKSLNGQNGGQVMTACARQFQANQQAMQVIGQQIGQAAKAK